MARSLRLVLAVLALAIATLAPAGLAQGPPTPITQTAQGERDLALVFVLDAQGRLMAIVGQGQAAALGVVAAVQACAQDPPTPPGVPADPTNPPIPDVPSGVPCSDIVPVPQAMAILNALVTESGQAVAYANAATSLARDGATGQATATVNYVTGISAGYVETLVGVLRVAVLTATNTIHHAKFSFDQPLGAATTTVQGKSVPDPTSETVAFSGGFLGVTASMFQASGDPLSYDGYARLVLTSPSGAVRSYWGTIQPFTPTTATFQVPYTDVADRSLNQTSWTMRVEAPRVKDGPGLTSPYAVANYNSKANTGAASALADQVPTNLLALTDRVPPVVQALTNLTMAPLRSNVTRNIDVAASDNTALARVTALGAYQDLKGRLHKFAIPLQVNTTVPPANTTVPAGTRYVGNVTPPPGMARLYYLVTAVDVGGNVGSLLKSADLPLPPAVARPAPAIDPLPAPTPAPVPVKANATVVPPPPIAEPATSPPAPAAPPIATTRQPNVAPASSAFDPVEASVSLGVVGGLFGLPMLLFFLTKL